MAITDDIKQTFKQGSSLVRLIYINIGVYLAVNIVGVIFYLMNSATNGQFSLITWLAVPASLGSLAIKPWTVFSYMFLHENFLHILVNMLWLFWFGKIFLLFLTQKQLTYVYVLGGLTGAAFYILFFNIFPVFNGILPNSVALGASASVMAIVIAISAYRPDYPLNLMFIGQIKLKYIAIATIALDLISIPSSNSGGHIAHLGGAFYGYLFAVQLKKGVDLTHLYSRLFESLTSVFRRRKKMKVSHVRDMTDWEYNEAKKMKQERIDGILDKLSKSGYESLSKEEKDILFNASGKKE
ncbi:MAG: rhomboid family intramembrane serine protease [Bacteroidia bacterium]|nr:rhomboid family intramembrane serine protease [Bacteroidia bacterium]